MGWIFAKFGDIAIIRIVIMQCFVWVWVVGLGGAGTGCHMGGRSRLPMRLVVGGCPVHPHPSLLPSRERGIADQVRNDVTMRCIVL